MEPDDGEEEWRPEWQEWMDEMESHIEFRGERTMAESLRTVYETGDGYAVDSK